MKKHSMSHSSTHSPVVAGRQLAVVIVNYRTASLTIDSIRSLSRETDSYSLNCRVIVVDNASGDGSVEQITAAIEDQGWGEWVSVLAMDRNGGFSAGNNAGIHEILSADPEVGYILLLNPDTIVQPGGLRELVEFLDRHPRAGIAGSRLENADFTVQCSAHRRPSPLGELEDTAKLGVISKLLSRARISPPPRQEAHPCDWVSGASLIIRREVFDQIGFFDEGYFLYFEEVDLCLRAQRAGWEVWYVPASRVVHLEGASTGIANGRKRRGRYWYDSRRRFYVKHYGLCGLLATDMLWVLGRLVFLARHLGGLDGSTAGDPKRFAADLLWGGYESSCHWEMARALLGGDRVSHVGVVVIGRNEGERLRRCLQSVVGHGRAVVYVDSGSIDNSLELARSLGVHVLELDCSQPFSAARARNAGFERLMSIAGDVEYVQFVDGDCELIPTWIDQAVDELNRRNDVAVVCGRLRERHPEASIYNRLCDLEWNGQPGEVNECGGIAICRADCFRQTGGFNIQLVAGEEPELCVRLRQCGWRIIRLADDMAYHDANMTRFGQCWKRTVRAGYAFAQGSAMHGQSPQRHWVRESRSNWFWGLVVPLVAGGLAGPTWGFSLLLLLGYPLLSVRIYRRMRGRGLSKSDARLYAMFCVAAKIPLAWGQMLYWKNRLLAKPGKLIEYKTPVELSGQA